MLTRGGHLYFNASVTNPENTAELPTLNHTDRLYKQRAKRLTTIYNGYEPLLPPLYPEYVDLQTALEPDVYIQQVRDYYSLCTNTDFKSLEKGPGRLTLTPNEDQINQTYAKHFTQGSHVKERLRALYVGRFPNREAEVVESKCAIARHQTQTMLHTLLEHATLVPRVIAHRRSLAQRDKSAQQALGPLWATYLKSGMVAEATVERTEDKFRSAPFCYELPFADFARLPPNQQMAIAQHFATETLEFTELLMQHYVGGLTNPNSWSYGGRTLAEALLNGSVSELKEAIAIAPSASPKELIHDFIKHGSVSLFDTARQLQEKAERLKLEATAAAAAAAVLARETTFTAYRKTYEDLLADPEVNAELARLESGTLIQLGSEGEAMRPPDFERIIEKHMRLVGHALRNRALDDPVNCHPYPIEFEGQLDNDVVNVGALLADEYYGKRENLWISVVPFDEEFIKTKFTKRGWSLVDSNHVVRLCIGVDLHSTGKEPFTNMVDVLVCVRRLKNKEQSEVSVLLRKPSLGQGTDYLRSAASLRAHEREQWQLGHVKLGGIPGAGKTRKHG